MTEEELGKAKEILRELLQKMVTGDFEIKERMSGSDEGPDVVSLNIEMDEPQILIGKNGQTLLELQHILGLVLRRSLKRNVYLKLDINNYQNQKVEHLKNLARESAEQVISTQIEKVLPPMTASERRIVHMELSKNSSITTESRGEGIERCVVIKPKM